MKDRLRIVQMGRGDWWRTAFWVSVAAAVLMVASISPHLLESAELTRMRNALLIDAEPAEYHWAPTAIPDDFRADRGAVGRVFAESVGRNFLAAPGDDWETALRIGRHLLQAVDSSTAGRPIQSSLENSYRRIVEGGEGYCGDFADVFTALATAAGLFSRPWAFSFEGFGGRGHIFNEVWDGQSGSWRMIDVFNNFYPTDSAGQPLSAIAFRTALERGAVVELMPIDPHVRPGFVQPERAIAYYRRGLPEWYLWWGNNVFEYDSHPAVRIFGGVSRSLEQLAAIAVGVHPRIRVLQMPENVEQRAAMSRLAAHLKLLAIGFPLALLSAAFCLWRARRAVHMSALG